MLLTILSYMFTSDKIRRFCPRFRIFLQFNTFKCQTKCISFHWTIPPILFSVVILAVNSWMLDILVEKDIKLSYPLFWWNILFVVRIYIIAKAQKKFTYDKIKRPSVVCKYLSHMINVLLQKWIFYVLEHSNYSNEFII